MHCIYLVIFLVNWAPLLLLSMIFFLSGRSLQEILWPRCILPVLRDSASRNRRSGSNELIGRNEFQLFPPSTTSDNASLQFQSTHVHCLALKLMLYICNIAFLRNKPRFPNALHNSKTSAFLNLLSIDCEPLNTLTKITNPKRYPTNFIAATTEFDEWEFIAEEFHFKAKGFHVHFLCSMTKSESTSQPPRKCNKYPIVCKSWEMFLTFTKAKIYFFGQTSHKIWN